MSVIYDCEGHSFTYEAIRELMNGEAYTMALVGEAARSVESAVNAGIDPYLEACYVPDRGDNYEWVGHRLKCSVSPESFPVLLRRLSEMGEDEALLASDMIYVLVHKGCD